MGSLIPRVLLAGGLIAGTWCVVPNAANAVPVDAATDEQAAAAQQVFQEADRLFDDQKYEEAIEKYHASHAIVASPNSRLMIARSLRELGRLPEAHAEYEAALADARQAAASLPQYQQTVQAAEDELQALRSRVGLLSIDLGDVPPTSQVTVAGREVDPADLEKPVVVMPGTVEVIAVAPDGQRAQAEVRAAAGRESSIRLALGQGKTVAESAPTVTQPASPPGERSASAPDAPPGTGAPSSGSSTYAYLAGGVGAAGMVAFAVFGLMNNSTFNELEADCPAGHCPPDRADAIDRGRTYQNLANISAIIGALGLGTGVTLLLLGGQKEAPDRTALMVGPAELRLTGKF